jgi:threonine dehydrogenase-like Zn-dependent dehydrogenase
MLARHLGYSRIAAADTDPERRGLARELGAGICLDPAEGDIASAVREWSPGGVDLVIEAVGVDATRSAAIAAVRKGGRAILLGLHDQVSPTDYAAVVRNEVALVGSFAYTRRDFAASLEALVKGDLDPSPYARTMPLERGQEAFELLSRTPGRTLKVLLTP